MSHPVRTEKHNEERPHFESCVWVATRSPSAHHLVQSPVPGTSLTAPPITARASRPMPRRTAVPCPDTKPNVLAPPNRQREIRPIPYRAPQQERGAHCEVLVSCDVGGVTIDGRPGFISMNHASSKHGAWPPPPTMFSPRSRRDHRRRHRYRRRCYGCRLGLRLCAGARRRARETRGTTARADSAAAVVVSASHRHAFPPSHLLRRPILMHPPLAPLLLLPIPVVLPLALPWCSAIAVALTVILRLPEEWIGGGCLGKSARMWKGGIREGSGGCRAAPTFNWSIDR